MEIQVPQIFNYLECLRYMDRSADELAYTVRGKSIDKLIEVKGQRILIRLSASKNKSLLVNFPLDNPSQEIKQLVAAHVREWFDLHTPLEIFYQEFESDALLGSLISDFRGLRLVKITDLFEAICWTIIGQQINLRFAYQVKKNLFEHTGEYIEFEGRKIYLWPKPADVLRISDTDFRSMKFSKQKVNYIRGVADLVATGLLDKKMLLAMDREEVCSELVKIKGIGEWSANYVMMRCLHFRNACPEQDVGLHNALKIQLKRKTKPQPEEVRMRMSYFQGWRAYATFYLWRSLLIN